MVDIVHVTQARLMTDTVILDDVFDDALDSKALERFLAQANHALFVALEGEQIIGQARGMLHMQPDGPVEFYLDNLGVAPFYHRRGIGTALVEALLTWARQKGAASFWVITEPENDGARALYSQMGLASRTVQMFEG